MALDVDVIEWRSFGGAIVPVGVTEITRVDNGIIVNDTYLGSIIHRFEARDLQATAARMVANRLMTNAYIILYREGCTEFWTYNLTTPNGWTHLTPIEMEKFLKRL